MDVTAVEVTLVNIACVDVTSVKTPVEADEAPIGVLLMVPPLMVRASVVKASVMALAWRLSVEVTVSEPTVA